MYSVKRMIGGFQVIDNEGKVIKEFKGKGSKYEAENFIVENHFVASKSEPKYRGGYRGGNQQ